jgi:hypothetical protein
MHKKHEHLEARLETFWRAQVLEPLVLLLNILAHALEFLSKRLLHARILNNYCQFFISVLRSND